MSRSAHAGRWVFATAILFFSRAFLFSTWVSRGPEVKHLLGVDTLMDMARTTVNLVGNCLASVVVAKWEGEFQEAKS